MSIDFGHTHICIYVPVFARAAIFVRWVLLSPWWGHGKIDGAWVPSPVDHSAPSNSCVEEWTRASEDLPSSHASRVLVFSKSARRRPQCPTLLRRLLTQPSICGTTSPTSRSFWRTPLTRSPCTGLCPRPSRLPTRTVTGTCPMQTQRGPGSRGGTTMAPGFRMSSGPRCPFPLGNDRQMWIICRVTIPGAHSIGRILLAILCLLTLRVHTRYHCRNEPPRPPPSLRGRHCASSSATSSAAFQDGPVPFMLMLRQNKEDIFSSFDTDGSAEWQSTFYWNRCASAF